ncbi:hypothetical protein C8J57DRAFT_1729017 [Mycena rebaudengoi]|nr:hypothetical protein C8J57DRAFT_1729017 [Mycena rebaudengoi]
MKSERHDTPTPRACATSTTSIIALLRRPLTPLLFGFVVCHLPRTTHVRATCRAPAPTDRPAPPPSIPRAPYAPRLQIGRADLPMHHAHLHHRYDTRSGLLLALFGPRAGLPPVSPPRHSSRIRRMPPPAPRVERTLERCVARQHLPNVSLRLPRYPARLMLPVRRSGVSIFPCATPMDALRHRYDAHLHRSGLFPSPFGPRAGSATSDGWEPDPDLAPFRAPPYYPLLFSRLDDQRSPYAHSLRSSPARPTKSFSGVGFELSTLSLSAEGSLGSGARTLPASERLIVAAPSSCYSVPFEVRRRAGNRSGPAPREGEPSAGAEQAEITRAGDLLRRDICRASRTSASATSHERLSDVVLLALPPTTRRCPTMRWQDRKAYWGCEGNLSTVGNCRESGAKAATHVPVRV